ncbi:conopressin/neurophysin-like [Haliotis asinina]|uniref:conopressin/neurophysin-like n=1 Tax=Haliotis asinina TaxID=109174 RepID=UPI003531B082
MVSASAMQVSAIVVLFGCVISGTLACFIRNCPPGGKRGLDMSGHNARECMACGPGGRGQCVGPNICCGSDIGCYFGTQEASICQKENESSTPCVIRGATCGSRGQGHCVSEGMCCDEEACSFNSRCDVRARDQPTSKADLIKLVQQLLRSKNYD